MRDVTREGLALSGDQDTKDRGVGPAARPAARRARPRGGRHHPYPGKADALRAADARPVGLESLSQPAVLVQGWHALDSIRQWMTKETRPTWPGGQRSAGKLVAVAFYADEAPLEGSVEAVGPMR